MVGQHIPDIFREATGMSIGWALIMIVLGIAAILMPYETGIGVSTVVAWIVVLSGLAYVAYAFAASGARGFVGRMLIGVVYVIGGGYLAFHRELTLESLTIVIAIIFCIEGVIEIAAFFELRALHGSGWILFDGIASLALTYLILRPWPSSSNWAVGVILGANLIVSGVTRLMYAVSLRKTLKAIA